MDLVRLEFSRKDFWKVRFLQSYVVIHLGMFLSLLSVEILEAKMLLGLGYVQDHKCRNSQLFFFSLS